VVPALRIPPWSDFSHRISFFSRGLGVLLLRALKQFPSVLTLAPDDFLSNHPPHILFARGNSLNYFRPDAFLRLSYGLKYEAFLFLHRLEEMHHVGLLFIWFLRVGLFVLTE
jgi:hypothetical protein